MIVRNELEKNIEILNQSTYIVIMKTRIIQIGNSQGIRIPKILLDQSGLGEEVELKVSKEQITIRPTKKPRQGWEEAFQKMAENGEDKLLDKEQLPYQSSWDQDDWVW